MSSRRDYSNSEDEDSADALLYRNRGKHTVPKGARRWATVGGRRLLFAACACLTMASLFGLMTVTIWSNQVETDAMDNEVQHSGKPVVVPEHLSPAHVPVKHPKVQVKTTTVTVTAPALPTSTPKSLTEKWGPLSVLRGRPTESFRDNLRPDQKYISSWPSAGWTNDVMTYANLIYLGLLTGRIPIIPAFVPSHIGGDAGSIMFGEVFNTTRLSESIGMAVIEWKDVKTPGSPHMDELGCWDVWQATQYDEHFPRRSGMLDQLNLDVSYTQAPDWVKLMPGEVNDKHATFWSLASLGFSDTRQPELRAPRPSIQHQVTLPPDEHLLCFDYLYYVCAQRPYEYIFEFSPAWRFVAQYMRWTDRIDHLADLYIRRTLGLDDHVVTPLYIAVHVRHHDFEGWCGDVPVKDCFAPIPVIARRVEEVRAEILQKRGFDVKQVIITSDEDDPEWWAEIHKLGWRSPDHTNTNQDYGRWWPVLIDAAIQSNGVGFVGTDRSTMSEMAERRCQSWHQGITRTVKWGFIGADDH